MSHRSLAGVLGDLTTAARVAGLTDAAWARSAGLPKETLCRLRRRSSCDFATLDALAKVVDRQWGVWPRPAATDDGGLWPAVVDRALERHLLDLVARDCFEPALWREAGPAFFVAGLAVMMASADPVARVRYLALAEALHPGATALPVFRRWLAATPLPPARFLPQLGSRPGVRPEAHTEPAYVEAFADIARRIAAVLGSAPAAALPIRMYVAGGAALHFYTGVRVSVAVDAVFSHRIVLPADLDVAYLDADGSPRLVYFDRQYIDTLGPLHEDAHDDSPVLDLDGVDAAVLQVRLLAPLDLAVSKLSRYSAQDQADIAALAARGMINPPALERRATDALVAYVGDVTRVRANLGHALGAIARVQTPSGQRRRKQDEAP